MNRSAKPSSTEPQQSERVWLVTGVAGFIGMNVAMHLLARGDVVIGIDNLNDYYDVALKHARLAKLQACEAFSFRQIDIADQQPMEALFSETRPTHVIHLAAQAGVRYSLINPHAYVRSNLQGFTNMLECCRHHKVEHLVYASSSSVYGGNVSPAFSESDNVDHPLSLYAATKKANELMAHTYSHLYRLPTSGLRFFTVYGPWGRPDMAPMLFTKAILAGEPINVFNNGHLVRDFTFIDDIVEGVVRVADKTAVADPTYDPQKANPASSDAPYRVFNIGNNQPVPLMTFISALEEALCVTAQKNYLPMQPGDVLATSANTDALDQWVGFQPNTAINHGVGQFVQWYRNYYKV